MMSHDVNFIFMESTGDMNLNELNPLYPIQKLYPLLYPIKYEPILSIIISHYILPEGNGHFFKRKMMDDPLMTSRKRRSRRNDDIFLTSYG